MVLLSRLDRHIRGRCQRILDNRVAVGLDGLRRYAPQGLVGWDRIGNSSHILRASHHGRWICHRPCIRLARSLPRIGCRLANLIMAGVISLALPLRRLRDRLGRIHCVTCEPVRTGTWRLGRHFAHRVCREVGRDLGLGIRLPLIRVRSRRLYRLDRWLLLRLLGGRLLHLVRQSERHS